MIAITFLPPPIENQNTTKENLNDLYGTNVNVGSFSQKPNGEAILSGVKTVEPDFHNEAPSWYDVIVNNSVGNSGTAAITPNDKCPYYTIDVWEVNWTFLDKHNVGDFFDGAPTAYNLSMNYHDLAIPGNNNQNGHYYWNDGIPTDWLAEIKQQIANTNFDGTPINFNQLQFADPIYDLDNNLYTIRVTPVPNSTFYDNSSSLDLIIYADVWTPINNFDDIRTLVADQTDVKAFLTNDIIFDGTTDWGTPISYSGVFDGRMHKIENLNFKYYGASCAPFMLGFQSTMKNIKIYNPVLSGTTAWSSDSKRISLFWSRVSNNSEPINSVYYQNIQVFGGNISGSGWTNKSVFDAHMMTSSAANNIYNISNYVLVNMSNLNSGLWDAIRSTTIGNTINVTQNIITSNTSGSICGAGNSTGSETTTVNTNGLIWDSQLNTKSRFNSGYNSNFKINDTSGTVSGVNTATAKNESTYIDRGFDFNYVWKLDQENNGYPSLRIPVTIHRD